MDGLGQRRQLGPRTDSEKDVRSVSDARAWSRSELFRPESKKLRRPIGGEGNLGMESVYRESW
jgi:hypothetical protein